MNRSAVVITRAAVFIVLQGIIIGGIVLIGLAAGGVIGTNTNTNTNTNSGADSTSLSPTALSAATITPTSTVQPDEPSGVLTDPPADTAAPTVTDTPTSTSTPTLTTVPTRLPVRPTATPTLSPTPEYVITTQLFPVYFCTLVGGREYEWYAVEITYHDGVAVSEEIVGGPFRGIWQPGCPGNPDDYTPTPAEGGDGGGAPAPTDPPPPVGTPDQ